MLLSLMSACAKEFARIGVSSCARSRGAGQVDRQRDHEEGDAEQAREEDLGAAVGAVTGAIVHVFLGAR